MGVIFPLKKIIQKQNPFWANYGRFLPRVEVTPENAGNKIIFERKR